MPRRARLGLLLALAVLLADQLSKFCLIALLAGDGALRLLPWLNLVMVWNRGVSFGMLAGDALGPWPFVVLSGVIVVALGIWLWRLEGRLLAAAVGLVIGGAVGNMIDRVVHGAVADFFDFHIAGYHWPAFNLADSAIVVGVGAIILDAFLGRRRPEAKSGPGS